MARKMAQQLSTIHASQNSHSCLQLQLQFLGIQHPFPDSGTRYAMPFSIPAGKTPIIIIFFKIKHNKLFFSLLTAKLGYRSERVKKERGAGRLTDYARQDAAATAQLIGQNFMCYEQENERHLRNISDICQIFRIYLISIPHIQH